MGDWSTLSLAQSINPHAAVMISATLVNT